ncbi:collagen alpha-1(I) chain-like [Motacilla alba alba]|uniref:collagen alpha-1(I) chain-like n=1 Tax=Motacilla alba alba TaxID=1094192 RepID=UPI0018D53636|nr:collagen alpha-1(I) chain-like [Motacilla alba alba]
MAVPWQGFSPLVSAGWRGRELRGANADMSQCAVPARRGTEPSVPRRHSHFTNPLYQSDAQPCAQETGTCTCPPGRLGFIHSPGAARRSRAPRSCRGLPGPAPPAAGRGQGGAARQRPAPGTRSLQRPRGGLRRLCPPWAQPHRGCLGTGGFLRAEVGGSRAGSGDRCRRQPKAGRGRSACSRLSSPSSCSRPCVRPSVPPGLSSRLPPPLPPSPEEKLRGPEAGRTGSELPGRNAFPGAQPPATLSRSRAPRAASGSGPVSGAAQRPGSPREPVHDKFHRALALNVGKPHGERKGLITLP